eukprot:superscaffoldBa00004853_g19533
MKVNTVVRRHELGPLDPDWFDVLTAQAVSTEGNVSDQDDLCANQEGNFKTPFDETAVESQLFSTPKVFRRCRVVSPETKDEQSFTAEPGFKTASNKGIRISSANLERAKRLFEQTEEIQTLENIELARDMQDMRIRKKKRQTIRPLPGSLFLTKTSGVSRIPLKDAVNGKPPAKYTQKQ